MQHPIVEQSFAGDPADLLLPVTPDNEPFWSALARGELKAQQCSACDRFRHPIAPVCPYCGAISFDWRNLSGRGVVFSWVRYQRSYLPEFEQFMPYVVATVQLEEGIRMFGRLVGKADAPAIDRRVTLVIERWPCGRCVPTFEAQ